MSEDSTVLSALLDYYSDKASAEASAVVASTFGLFVILTVNVPNFWKFLIFWILWGAGFYFLMGFGYWAHHANMTKQWLTGRSSPDEKSPKDEIIEREVRLEWKKTFMHNLYYRLKYSQELCACEWITREKRLLLRLSDLIHTGFFFFGWLLSNVFFPSETWAFYGIMLSFVLWGMFIFDVFSIANHRRFTRERS